MYSRRRSADHLRLALVLLAFAPDTALADTFRYVDRRGQAHEVDVSADDVPLPSLRSATDEEKRPTPSLYLAYAEAACAAYKVPLPLVLAVIRVESGFNPRAVSRRGALGLMQLMPATAAELGVLAPFDPQQNIDGGVRYLRELLDTFSGDLELALAAYHAGPGRVQRAQGAPFDVTRRYVQDVLRLYQGTGSPGR